MKKENKKDLICIILIFISGIIFMFLLSARAEQYDKNHKIEKSPAYYNNELLPQIEK